MTGTRKGWCPGALRPMPSGDGLIVRLRIDGGTVCPALGHALAGCAGDFGNGLIDLTARANLQLRGVRAAALPALHGALAKLGLLDADPDAEAVRNVMASPLAGIDPAALIDIRPCVRALDARLRSDTVLHQLPAKFGFAIDDGGSLPLPLDAADVAFLAGNGSFAVYLGGESVGRCGVDAVPDVGVRLGRVFLELRGVGGEAPRRMAGLVRRIGTEAIARAAGIDATPCDGPRRRLPRLLGERGLGRYRAFGAGVPFGRLDAKVLARLSDEAAAVNGELRLTPWRAIFVVSEHIDGGLGARLANAGLICDDADPRRAVAACGGMPACPHGSTATHADGTRLAALARGLGGDGVTLHVSGCAKGCAHPRRAAVTLVGRDGRYDLVRGGRANDPPAFAGLEIGAVETELQRMAASQA